MSFGQWYVSRGRIPRRVYWLYYVLPLLGASIVATVIDATFDLWLLPPNPAAGPAWLSGMGLLITLVALATLVPGISSQVTRLHDRGHSAWWLLWNFLPLAGAIVLIVQTGFLRGQPGPNRYGPPTDQPVGHPVSR